MSDRLRDLYWLRDDLKWVLRTHRWDVWERLPPVDVPPGAWLVRTGAPDSGVISWYPPFFTHPLEVVAAYRGNWAGRVTGTFPTREQMAEYNGYRNSFTRFITKVAADLYLTVPEAYLLYHLLTPFHTVGGGWETVHSPAERRRVWDQLGVPGDPDKALAAARTCYTPPVYRATLVQEYSPALPLGGLK